MVGWLGTVVFCWRRARRRGSLLRWRVSSSVVRVRCTSGASILSRLLGLLRLLGLVVVSELSFEFVKLLGQF